MGKNHLRESQTPRQWRPELPSWRIAAVVAAAVFALALRSAPTPDPTPPTARDPGRTVAASLHQAPHISLTTPRDPIALARLAELESRVEEIEAISPPPPPLVDESIDDAAIASSLERRIGAEATDQEWLTIVHTRALDLLAKPIHEGTRLRSVTCGSTICRLDVEAKDSAHQRNFIADVSALLDDGAEAALYSESDEDLSLEVWMTRSGPTLPRG